MLSRWYVIFICTLSQAVILVYSLDTLLSRVTIIRNYCGLNINDLTPTVISGSLSLAIVGSDNRLDRHAEFWNVGQSGENLYMIVAR